MLHTLTFILIYELFYKTISPECIVPCISNCPNVEHFHRYS